METLFFIIEGSLKIQCKEDEEVVLNKGEIMALEDDIHYDVEVVEDTKICTILVKA
jgi:mannose-6-phosphate isomerase-like protein (cupin superfamily)